MSLQAILSRLKKVKKTKPGSYLACCPVHDDKTPSLAVTEKQDGTVLIHCFGCGAGGLDVCSAVGVEPSELFPPNDNPRYAKQSRNGFNAWQLLSAMRQDIVFLTVAANQMSKAGLFDNEDIDALHGVSRRLVEGLESLEGTNYG